MTQFHDRAGGEPERASQSAPPSLVKRSFAFSVAVHAALILAIVAVDAFSSRPKKNTPRDVMVEFTVAVPPTEETPAQNTAEPDKPEPEPKPDPPKPTPPEPKPDPEPIPVVEKPKPPDKPKFEKGRIVRRDDPKPNRNIVEKPKEPAPQKPKIVQTRRIDVKGPKLSDAEIRKLLDQGARPADRTSIPSSERERCFALIYSAIKRAWICPDATAISSSEPEIEFTLGAGGSLSNVRLVRSSGNATLDQSVVNAAKAVRSVSGLTQDFIRANPRLTVAFSLEGV